MRNSELNSYKNYCRVSLTSQRQGSQTGEELATEVISE